MLYLVEGLNCSGKSTFIENMCQGDSIVTDWLNPKRWPKGSYKSQINENGLTLPYLIGAYETFYRSARSLGFLRSKAIYVDRTWISAYAYGTIGEKPFEYLMSVHSTSDVNVTFIDTPVELCWERWVNEGRRKSKGYVKSDFEFWKIVDVKLREAIERMENFGFNVYKVKGS
jgi:hypothetical protein